MCVYMYQRRAGNGQNMQTSQLSRIARETHAFSMSPAKHIQISRRILLMCTRRRGSARLGTSVVDPSMVALPTVYPPYVGDLKGAYGTTRVYART